MLLIAGTIVTLLGAAAYFFFSYKYSFWKRYGLFTPKHLPILGNYADYILLKKSFGENVTDICNQFPEEPIIGTYYGTEPAVIVKDLELLKLIITKDFYYFSSREIQDHANRDIAFRNIFNNAGNYWRVVRQNLTPLFSSAKMKKMFYLIQERTVQYEKLLAKEIKEKQVHEFRSFNSRFTMDCICACIFGIDTNVLTSGPDNPFRLVSNQIFDFSPAMLTKMTVRNIWPSFYYTFKSSVFPIEIRTFFEDIIKGVFENRNNKPSSRNDFIDMLLTFKEKDYLTGDDIKSMKSKDASAEKIRLPLDDELLMAQCVIFFGAGFETSATTMDFTLFELAKSPKVLQKVLDEVDEHMKKHDGKVTYECVTDLPYLEACVEETLRLYPVLPSLTREVVEDYTLPSGLVLKKGVRVHIPVKWLHHHPEHFSDPLEYRPERFLAENKRDVKPYTYYPFGEGPRTCIGMRFAKMQMMAGMVTLLKDYSVEVPPHMPRQLTFIPTTFTTTQPKEKLELKFLPRHVKA